MTPNVTLIVTRGPLAGQRFSFRKGTCCVIGRSRDCAIALPLEREHLDVSRHHCLLEIDPPTVRVRDLGSLNGTFVNGRNIGQRDARQTPESSGPLTRPPVELADGDEIRLGEHTAFRVCLSSPAPRAESAHPARRSSGEFRLEGVSL